MASLQLPVGEAHHITLFHFETMDEDKLEEIAKRLLVILGKVKRGPEAVYGAAAMFGWREDIPVFHVTSTYLHALREAIRQEFEKAPIVYYTGRKQEWQPHVSNPTPEMKTGDRIDTWNKLTLIWGGKVYGMYELGSQQ